MEAETTASSTPAMEKTIHEDDKGDQAITESGQSVAKVESDNDSGNKENVSNDVEAKEEIAEGETKVEDDTKKEENDCSKEDSKTDKNAEAEWDKNILFVSGMPPGEAGVSICIRWMNFVYHSYTCSKTPII